MNLAKQNIEELILMCRKQDQKAQFEIYKRYSDAMFNVAIRIVKDSHYAEDVMQEGFLKAFTKIDHYRQEVAFGAWLKRIIINYSLDFYKKQNSFKTDDLDSILYKIEDNVTDDHIISDFNHIKVNQVLCAIQGLKDNYRLILTLHLIEGYDQEEITDIMKISYANCRTMISRAKEKLRVELQAI